MVRSSNWSEGARREWAGEVSKGLGGRLLGTDRLRTANDAYKQASMRLGAVRREHDVASAAANKRVAPWNRQGRADRAAAQGRAQESAQGLRARRKEYQDAATDRMKAIGGIGARVAGVGGVGYAGLRGAQTYTVPQQGAVPGQRMG